MHSNAVSERNVIYSLFYLIYWWDSDFFHNFYQIFQQANAFIAIINPESPIIKKKTQRFVPTIIYT